MKTPRLLLLVTATACAQLALLGVQGAPFAEVNWALTGTATQSSDHSGALASRAIDGNTSILWADGSISHTENTDDPPWWEVDFGGVKSIGRVSIWVRIECCQTRNEDLTLIVLDAARTEVARQQYAGRPPSNFTYDFAPAIRGQFVRIEGQTPRTSSDGYLSLAEVQVIAPYDGITINITKNLADVRIVENQSATFGPVTIQAADVPQDKFRYQWQLNGVDLAGATAATYTTAPQKASDTGAEYTVRLGLPGTTVLSAKAKLTVVSDPVPPLIASTSVAGGATLQFSVNYSELMDLTTATNKANYVFGAGISVSSVALSGPSVNTNNNISFNSAILSVLGLAPNTDYSLTVSGVKDLAGNTLATTNLTGNVGFYEINYARAGTATQSSDLDAVHTAVVAIDGKTNGNWGANTTTHTRNTDDPPWWEVDLGAAKEVGRVSVWFRTDCCQNRNDDFTVTLLDANRSEVWKRQYAGRPPRNVAYDMIPALQGKFIRVEGQTPRTTSDGFQSLTEVEVIAPYQNVTFDITQGPADATALESRTATLGPVRAQVTGAPEAKLVHQWQKNGTDIPGATGASYTTPILAMADNAAEYSVKVSLPGFSKVSAKARITVTKDQEAPKLISVDSVASADAATFSVEFDELMDPASSALASNYSFGAGISVTEAALNPNGKTATLKITGLGAGTRYTLAVSGVKDLGGNTVAATTVRGTVQMNYALAGTASQSSDGFGGTPGKAIDGNTSQLWGGGSITHTLNTENPPVWEVDLGSTKTIGSVRIWYRTDCCVNRNDDITVYVLDSTRTEVTRRKYPGRPPSIVTHNFAPAIQGQHIRIEGQSPRSTSDGYLSLAEVQVFNPYETETISISEGPANATAVAGKTATLGPVKVSAPGVPAGKVSYQWQKNGVDIPNALGASYTTPVLTAADNGAEYSVRALLPGLATAFAKATLTVTPDPSATDVRLTFGKSGSGIRIAWPQSAAGFVLESTDSLSPAVWKLAAEAVVVQGAESSITLTSQSGVRFYRLVKR